ncbi:MAG TPA: (4Fe-4S)-binding protein [Solirubrobacteraceae bacterium]|nr:(4Fe-4S)-binding protein [Solirubrobacteraceae bacterium]
MPVKRYEAQEIVVTYDTARCLHAAECVRGMPAVFDTAKRPWVTPDAGDPAALAGVIARCPTGALHYTLRDGEPERPRVPTRVRLPDGGPLLIEGDLELEGQRETRAALCRCSESGNQPYCDGSGPCHGWSYEPGS